MQAPFPFDDDMLLVTLITFRLEHTPVHIALLAQMYQACATHLLERKKHEVMMTSNVTNAAAYIMDGPTPLGHQTLTCTFCANADVREFVHSYDDGDIICRKCGRVAVSNYLFEGDATRTFTGENASADDATRSRPHAAFPDARSYLFSDEHALRSAVAPDVSEHTTVSAKYTSDAALARGQTTTWCKDTDKQRCVTAIEDAAIKLGVCKIAVNSAIELFAALRDARQRVLHKRILMAACLLVCHAMSRWSRAFPVPLTTHAYTLRCEHCNNVFHSAKNRAQHTCVVSRDIRARKRKVHELDMLSF